MKVTFRRGFGGAAVLAVIFFFAGVSQAMALEVKGTQSGIWTANENPIIVSGDITIPAGKTLTIGPGVLVKFAGYYKIKVNGSLIVSGRLGERVVFTSIRDTDFGDDSANSAAAPTSKDWVGLEFTPSSKGTSVIDYCIIRYSDEAISANFATPTIKHTIIADCQPANLIIDGKVVEVQRGVEKDYNITPDYVSTSQGVDFQSAPELSLSSTSSNTASQSYQEAELLKEAEFTFGEIKVVSATKIEQTLEDAPAMIYVITREEIEANGWSSLEEILNFVPGFESMISAGSDLLYNIRGIGSPFNSRILFMIDGINVADAFHGGASRSAKSFSIPDIDRIEVITGPGSALYGAGAFSGIVNIIMESPEKSGFGAQFGSGNGGAGSVNSHLSFYREKFAFRFYANYLKDDGFQRPYQAYNTDRFDIIDPQDMRYFGGKINLLKYFTLDFNYSHHARVNGIGFNYPHAAQDMEIFGEYKNLSLQGNFPLHRKIQLNSTFYHRTSDWIGEGDVLSPEDMAVHPKFKKAYAAGKYPNGGYFEPLRYSTLLGTDIYTNIHATESVELVFGFAAERTDVSRMMLGVLSTPILPTVPSLSDQRNHDLEESVLLEGTENRMIYAGYAEASINVNKFSFVIGQRYDKYSDIGGNLNPRTGLVYRPTNSWTFKLLTGQAFRAPAIRDLYAFKPGIPVSGSLAFADSSWYEELKPEISQTYEFLTIFTPNANTQISVAGSYIKIDDIIFENTTTPVATYNNASKATSIGGTVSLQTTLGRRLHVSSNLSYYKTKTSDIPTSDNSEDGQGTISLENMFMSPILFNTWGTFDLSSHIKLAFGVNYRSSKVRGLYSNNGVDLVDPRPRVPAYTLFNMNLMIHKIYNRFTLNLGAKNLMDNEYLDPGPYPLAVANNPNAGDIPNRGRAIYANIKFEL
ncbi:MAG: TonB-dependent receptor plug domain-containing protein [Candidatus Zhuqueibacterota bacterium]